TSLPRALRGSPAGSIFEWRDDRVALDLGRRVRGEGAVLILDYGHVNYGLGDTLQAVAGHAYVDPLQSPGEADLTAHVDFEALAQSAESIGGRIHGPILQRDFLLRLGIKQRAATLKANASRDMALEIELALSRLTASGAQGMGELFKALAIADPKLGALPGFEAP
ncbi:MAG TPA: SAM-dependent methyltransferase, partial [Xanthobacteraceae bacterium]|nr:SAM-dependent methyltransferase [Xanthobacteraceae bacterium]